MNKLYFYKLNEIKSIIITDKIKNPSYSFHEEYYERHWLFFFKKILHTNVFVDNYYTFYTKEELLEISKRYIIVDNIVYYKPYVTINFGHHVEQYQEYFNSFEDATVWVKDIIEKHNLTYDIIKFEKK